MHAFICGKIRAHANACVHLHVHVQFDIVVNHVTSIARSPISWMNLRTFRFLKMRNRNITSLSLRSSPASSSSDCEAEIMTNWASVGRNHDHIGRRSGCTSLYVYICVCVCVSACMCKKKCLQVLRAGACTSVRLLTHACIYARACMHACHHRQNHFVDL